MTEFNKDDKVIRKSKGNYNLSKTNSIIKDHFKDLSHASTVDGLEGSDWVLYADKEGALICYIQDGSKSSSYAGKLGYLYYYNGDLELVKRPEEVINNYQIY